MVSERVRSVAGQAAAPAVAAMELPALYLAADRQAAAAERRFTRLVLLEIALPVITVVFSSVATVTGPTRWLGYAAVFTIAIVGALRVVERTSQIELQWYRARSFAEDVKSLAWRFAMEAPPFPPDMDGRDAETQFLERLRALTRHQTGLAPPDAGDEITTSMRQLRGMTLPERAVAYRDSRLRDQQRWYQQRARRLALAGQRWDVAFFLCVASTIVAGTIVVATANAAPVAGIASAAAGAVIGWTGVRRLTGTSGLYARMATELSLEQSAAPQHCTPGEWSVYVDAVERQLGREHAQWRSARQ
ncbi:MAG TPA: DUF4231 domain-containing protein [Acidimicrobiia bacterium]|nr:DUF4231 domain-containing protein [Acidimicrobiia bacterium]